MRDSGGTGGYTTIIVGAILALLVMLGLLIGSRLLYRQTIALALTPAPFPTSPLPAWFASPVTFPTVAPFDPSTLYGFPPAPTHGPSGGGVILP